MKLRVRVLVEDILDTTYNKWVIGYGVEVLEENDVLLHYQEPHANCFEYTKINWRALLDDIIESQSSYPNVTIDLGENPEDYYPQWFLEALM